MDSLAKEVTNFVPKKTLLQQQPTKPLKQTNFLTFVNPLNTIIFANQTEKIKT
jgi:hypothetical protein